MSTPVTATVARRVPGLELELTLHGPAEIDGTPATAVRATYRGHKLTRLYLLTTRGERYLHTDVTLAWPGWLPPLIEEHRPPADRERRRLADVLARHYDGRPLDDLREEHAAHHLEAADALLAPQPPAAPRPAPGCPCLPFQRYGCGHCPHTDCQNPDCGHCPCKCSCH